MATRIFGCQMDYDDPKRTAREGVEAFKNFLRELHMPLTFQEIGADPASIPRLVEMNNIGDGVTGGYVGLDRAAHFEIYETAAGLR
jgi:alcohol dehydrogenase YqhD (iron-dependent ADH family)